MSEITDIIPNIRITSKRGDFLYSFHLSSRKKSNEDVHSHIESCLAYVESGSGILKLKDRTTEIQRGDLILLRSTEEHHISSSSDEEDIIILGLNFFPCALVTYAPDYVDQMLAHIFYSTTPRFENILPKDSEHTDEIIKKMFEIKKEVLLPKPNIYALRVILLGILSRITDIFNVDDFEKDDVTIKHKYTILASLVYMHENLTNDISLEDLARHANMEVSHYSSVFRSFQGISPWKYFIKLRVELAAEYLKDSESTFTILEIANMTGFKNLSNFNKIFKSIIGTTPSKYRTSQALFNDFSSV